MARDYLDVTGVVLAGGRSRRFGEDKAGFHVDGRPMISHVVDAVASLCPAVLISIGRDPSTLGTNVRYIISHAASMEIVRSDEIVRGAANVESVRDVASGAGGRIAASRAGGRIAASGAGGRIAANRASVRIVRDRLVDGGPLAGIQASMQVADTPWLLVVACDMPLMTPEALRSLLETRTADVHAVIACDGTERMHPLCACYRRDTLPEIESYLASGGRSVHGFLDRITTAGVTMDSDELLRNVNSKRDLPDES